MKKIARVAFRLRIVFQSRLRRLSAFTLIELSIVLVVIGLVIGSILVGRDLISTSYLRAQITQIQKYKLAVNLFREKTGYLPGDIPNTSATSFGLAARGSLTAQGDGNGILQANGSGTIYCDGYAGETVMFWSDLSSQKWVDEGFSVASSTSGPGFSVTENTTPALSNYFPRAKIDPTGYVYVYSDAAGQNYFGLSAVTAMGGSPLGSNPLITPKQSYYIDAKIDDGLPQSGKVQAFYSSWGFGSGNPGYGWSGPVVNGNTPFTTATAGYACFDNNSTAGVTLQYSIILQNSNPRKCGLSFFIE